MNTVQEREKLRYYLSPREMGAGGFDARYSVPDIGLECRRTTEDLILGCRPTTALGVLLRKRHEVAAKFPWYENVDEMPERLQHMTAMDEYTVSGLVHGHRSQVRWVLDSLVEEGFAEHLPANGLAISQYMAKVTLDRLAPLPSPYPSDSGGMAPGAL
jgi:hypothetical protein